MEKVDINGTPWIRLYDMCDILRVAAKPDIKRNSSDVVESIARMMFYDEYKAAKTEEEKQAAIELPGSFVVVRRLKKKTYYFSEWKQKDDHAEAVFTPKFDDAMIFTYESKADEIAERMNMGCKDPLFKVINIGKEDSRICKRVLDAIFEDEEDEDDDL